MSRLVRIYANLADRLDEAREQGWLGEVAAIVSMRVPHRRAVFASSLADSAPVRF
ncbi:hypothetical protein [Micromonospora phaseoli]|uniref:hypothetical protein n=1 Tax=Micromonospora phaseoli TaxID=1144548 RepID=UPI001587CACF|nr:hypothetical protein [Micromonospora phaseoli]